MLPKLVNTPCDCEIAAANARMPWSARVLHGTKTGGAVVRAKVQTSHGIC
jgi:hypothetical protein